MPPDPQSSSFEQCRELHSAGRFTTAYHLARGDGWFADPLTLPPAQAVLAGRLLSHAGARRRAELLFMRVWRRHRRDASAAVACVQTLADTGGPLRALDFMDHVGDAALRDADADHRATWLDHRAMYLASLRDFVAAERAWDEARTLHVDAFGWCARAFIMNAHDRVEDVLDAVAQARALRPWHVSAIELQANALDRLRRHDEARRCLIEAAPHLESVTLCMRLALRHVDAGELDAALDRVVDAIRHAPAMERHVHDAIASVLSIIHDRRGDGVEAARCLRLVAEPELDDVIRRLEAGGGRRVVLPVPHITQHHNTCAPATLTALAQFWGEEVSHLEIAEEICHDGTTAASERRWVEERGMAARELTLTWDAAVTLIDAGFPFSLSTRGTAGGHAQPVVGYDTRHRTLLTRDPSFVMLRDLDWDELAKRQAAFGPRAMAIAPAARRAELASLDLPDADLHDLHYAVEDALRHHDRVAARAAHDRLEQVAPGHRLTLSSRRALAGYDADLEGVADAYDRLRALFPDDLVARVMHFNTLGGIASGARRRELADGLMADAAEDPAVLAACAVALHEDPDREIDASALATRSIRKAHAVGSAFQVLANLAWRRGERRRATQLRRIASCLTDGDEHAAWLYFVAANAVGDAEAALEHLRARAERLTVRAAAPLGTLCDGLDALGRGAEASDLVERAYAAKPDDVELLQLAAERAHAFGRVERARELLDLARGRGHSSAWRATAASLAAQRGDLETAFALWGEHVAEHPLDLPVQHEYVRELVRRGDAAAATDHLSALSARFPFHVQLGELVLEHLATHDRPAYREHVAAAIERHPERVEARALLAADRLDAGDVAGARAALDAIPAARANQQAVVRADARVLVREGRRDDARARFVAAVEAEPDEIDASRGLLDLARDGAEAVEALDVIARAVEQRGSYGPGVAYLAGAIADWLDPQEARARCVALRARWPHVWALWRFEVMLLIDNGALDDARALIDVALERFADSPAAWVARAHVHEARREPAEEVAALERAHQLAPRDAAVVRLLADACRRAGDAARARQLVERVIAMEPWVAVSQAMLAELLATEGQRDAAVAAWRRAVDLDPEYGHAWAQLVADERARAETFALATALIRRRPGAVKPRLVLAEHDVDRPLDQRLALIGDASRAAPEAVAPHLLRVQLLGEEGRLDEAIAACRPSFWGDAPPAPLRARAADLRAARGELAQACDEMIAVIARSPRFRWAIDRTIDWALELDRYQAYAERIVEVAPRSSLAHAHLGEALRLAEQLEPAEASYRRALELQADELLARLGMFDLHRARGEHDAAGAALDGLPEDHVWVMSKRVQLDATLARADAAEQRFVALIATDGVPDAIDQALKAMQEAGEADRAFRQISTALFKPDATIALARVWWRHVARVRTASWRFERILTFAAESPAARWAGYVHVGTIAERGTGALLEFIVGNYRQLRRHVSLWAATGAFLLDRQLARVARWWMRDWRTREGLRPWMLLALAEAGLLAGKVEDAWAIARHALTLPRDDKWIHFRGILAAPDALDDATLGASTVREIAGASNDEVHRCMIALAELVVGYRANASQPPDVRRRRFLDAIQVLAAQHPVVRRDPRCRNQYHAILRQLSQERDRPGGWWWWRSLR